MRQDAPSREPHAARGYITAEAQCKRHLQLIFMLIVCIQQF